MPSDLPDWLYSLRDEATNVATIRWDLPVEVTDSIVAATYHVSATISLTSEQAQVAQEQALTKTRVGTGPTHIDLAGLRHTAQLWLDTQDPSEVLVALDTNYPPFLWIPAGRTLAALNAVLTRYFLPVAPADTALTQHCRVLLGTHYKWSSFEAVERAFVLIPFCEKFHWGTSQAGDPYQHGLAPGLVGLLDAQEFQRNQPRSPLQFYVRTVHSQSIVQVLANHKEFLANIAYQPAAHATVITTYNTRFACDFPLDLPVDVVATLLPFLNLTARQVLDYLADDLETQYIPFHLTLLALLKQDDPSLTEDLQAYAAHTSVKVRRALAQAFSDLKSVDHLQNMAAGESNARLQHDIQVMLAKLAPSSESI
ncbi:MAG: hypothetical protein H0U76_24545 [Ktedonobacteraceae bacterium]|nr:hypothetical protein [Ktedonobacteraceae bacterium]